MNDTEITDGGSSLFHPLPGCLKVEARQNQNEFFPAVTGHDFTRALSP